MASKIFLSPRKISIKDAYIFRLDAAFRNNRLMASISNIYSYAKKNSESNSRRSIKSAGIILTATAQDIFEGR